MDRLICGDVGYGKTEVAIRAAYRAVMNGKQVAILVPTTVLAQQHYNTFRERLSPFPVVVEMLSRFRSPLQQRDILNKLAQGSVDIVIGTHRLIQGDVRFKDLGLLIIDEEQRVAAAVVEKPNECDIAAIAVNGSNDTARVAVWRGDSMIMEPVAEILAGGDELAVDPAEAGAVLAQRAGRHDAALVSRRDRRQRGLAAVQDDDVGSFLSQLGQRLLAGSRPAFEQKSVVNAASFEPGLSPGSIYTLFGSGLSGLPGIVNTGIFDAMTCINVDVSRCAR
jgi:hypothetical protein